MKPPIGRLLERMRGRGPGGSGDYLGLALGVLTLAVCVGIDILLDSETAALVGTYVAAPFVAALFAGPVGTGLVGAAAVGAAAASPLWNPDTGNSEHAVRIVVIAAGAILATGGALIRARSAGRSERLGLLSAVGGVADGSLPLTETLARVTELVVPAFADICMIDSVRDGRAQHLAVRASGRADSDVVEERLRRRPPRLPDWLLRAERSWRHLPEWWPTMHDEELRRMAHSRDDLEFLRSLGLRSSMVIPLRARDRNIGALTLISAWSGERYGANELRFGQILAGRIGLALDNAGLFSDLESIERRMDTVMAILDEAIVIHGADGELVFANPAAARMMGFETTDDALSAQTGDIRDRFEIRDEDGRTVAPNELVGRRALRGEAAGQQTLRAIDRATGRERWTRTRAQSIEGPAGEVLYSVTAIEDVTEVKRAEFSNKLLARTGELLSHSGDYRATLEQVPRLLVPEFADWCSIELPLEDGEVERVAIAHRDPERLRMIRDLRRRFPGQFADAGVSEALASGEALLYEMTEERLNALAINEEHLAGLRGLELASMIFAPMSIGGPILGVLVFVNHRGSRTFDESDLSIAIETARRAALAIENSRLAVERARVAEALQRELLPPNLPPMPGWEVATMYEPAGEVNEVGGDFYEVFRVEAGWAMVLGDVAGRGAAAAAITAEARHTIRTAGALAGDPVVGLEVLNRNLRLRDDVALCSVAMLVLPDEDAPDADVLIYLAGHPHPMHLHDGQAEQVGTPGPLLGVADEPGWKAVAVSLEVGDQLVLYTDGVIEARRRDGDRFGSDRLRQRLAGAESPDLAVERVRDGLVSFGARAREDDAAVIAIRRGGSPDAQAATASSPRRRATSSTSAAS
jgi:PAS domain S-box-containing protein